VSVATQIEPLPAGDAGVEVTTSHGESLDTFQVQPPSLDEPLPKRKARDPQSQGEIESLLFTR
jgi:hypothetical protein